MVLGVELESEGEDSILLSCLVVPSGVEGEEGGEAEDGLVVAVVGEAVEEDTAGIEVGTVEGVDVLLEVEREEGVPLLVVLEELEVERGEEVSSLVEELLPLGVSGEEDLSLVEELLSLGVELGEELL